MQPNCPVSCGSCGQLCLDYHDRCAEWAGRGECGANAAYMSSYCRKSCHCGGDDAAAAGAAASASACADAVAEQKCGYWAENGHCNDEENESFREYMRINCRKTCKLCKP